MAVPVSMPRQGQSVESCILTTWYAGVGDRVKKGDLLFAYETDKAAFEEESPEEGILLVRFFEEGEEIPVLATVAVIGKEGESVDAFRPRKGDSGQVAVADPDKAEPGGEHIPEIRCNENETEQLSGTPGEGKNLSISPRARRLATEKRVVIESIRGSGPGGRIIEKDVLEAYRQGKRLTPLASKKMASGGLTVPGDVGQRQARFTSESLVERTHLAGSVSGIDAGGEYTDMPLGNVRKIIAAAMHRSLQNSAQLTHHMGANASGMLQLRKEVKKRSSEGFTHNITLNDMVCFAVVRALEKFPEVNAHRLGDTLRRYGQVNLGVAVDTDRGLMVPVLLHADRYPLTDFSDRLKELSDKAKKGSISPDLIVPEAASFTVSNLGNYGVEVFTPIINLPQVAILGVNTILHRPDTLADGSFGFLPYMGLSLTYDHRAIDGGPATRFLAAIRDEVESLSPAILDP